MQDSTGVCRVIAPMKVRPWACYKLACWIKTAEIQGADLRLAAIGKNGRNLSFHEKHLESNKEWTEYDVVFNSLECPEISLYIGVWGPFKGKFWIDDARIEEVSLVNIIRRDACPFRITSDDGKATYEEGKDYQQVRDEKLGKDPYDGGEYHFHHEGAKIRLTEKSRINDGEKLSVSWYHPVLINDEQVGCSLSDPKVFTILEDQAKRVNNLLHPRTFFMSHDEIRIGGWDLYAQKSGKTPGQLLAENAKHCVEILRTLNPKCRIVVWSDMFDPYHNAVTNYYLVNGSLKGSWEGLPKDVLIANWNSGKAAESLKWFVDRGYEQVIAGYYDGDISNLQHWNKAAKGISGVNGFMYTTWQQKYTHLEEYGKALRMGSGE